MRRYLDWRQRNRIRFEKARSIDEYPGCFRLPTRLVAPGLPQLRPGEDVLFDFVVWRVSPNVARWLLPGLARSAGRLTITDERFIYRTRRSAAFLFLLKPPKSVGDIEFPLESISSLEDKRGLGRLVLGAPLPGLAVVELTVASGERVRFAGIARTQWDRVMQVLTDQAANDERDDSAPS